MNPPYRHILFDWGNTLMMDDGDQQGPMCDWPQVAAIKGAAKVLKTLSRHLPCHVATNADESDRFQVRRALDRVALGGYIDRIFCSGEIGHAKPAAAFFEHILGELACPPEDVLMVGDHVDKDIRGALAAGLDAIWFRPKQAGAPRGIRSFEKLEELIELI